MSWKATAFVKELRKGLTVTDKFVLLMLAEYHRTDDKLSWPSAATLADDCLIEERSVKRVLQRLEENGFLVRVKGGGRGKCTAYKFIGLDIEKGDRQSVIPETVIVETLIPQVVNSDPKTLNSDPPAHAIRKARVEQDSPVKTSASVGEIVYEPVEDQRQGVPDWVPLEPWMEFVKMRKKAKTPFTDHARVLAFQELGKLMAEGSDPREVLNQSILNGWKGLFPVGQNRGNGNGSSISKKQQLVNKNREAIARGLGLGPFAGRRDNDLQR